MDEKKLQDEERERELFEALDEAYEKGVSPDHLRTLLFETGARWVPPQQAA